VFVYKTEITKNLYTTENKYIYTTENKYIYTTENKYIYTTENKYIYITEHCLLVQHNSVLKRLPPFMFYAYDMFYILDARKVNSHIKAGQLIKISTSPAYHWA